MSEYLQRLVDTQILPDHGIVRMRLVGQLDPNEKFVDDLDLFVDFPLHLRQTECLPVDHLVHTLSYLLSNVLWCGGESL